MKKLRFGEECNGMLSSGHGMAVILMLNQLWLLEKIKPVKIPTSS